MDHFSQVGVLEVFLEATPTAFLFLILTISGLASNTAVESGLEQLLVGNFFRSKFFRRYESRDDLKFFLFYVTCASSIFSSVFGVSRLGMNKNKMFMSVMLLV